MFQTREYLLTSKTETYSEDRKWLLFLYVETRVHFAIIADSNILRSFGDIRSIICHLMSVIISFDY